MNIIASALILVPFLLPIWDKRPLLREDITFEGVYSFTKEDLSIQKEVFYSGNRTLILKTIPLLQKTDSKDVADFLVRFLNSTSDREITHDILQTLCFLPEGKKSFAKTALERMNSDTLHIKKQAIQLYGKSLGFSVKNIKKLLTKELSPELKIAVLKILYEHINKTSLDFWKKYISDTDEKVKNYAYLAIWKFKIKTNSQIKKIYLNADDITKAFLLKSIPQKCIHTENIPLINKIIHAGINSPTTPILSTAILKSIHYPSQKNLNQLISLSSYKDEYIRNLSSNSLASLPSKKSLSALIENTNDSVNYVRETAIKSIVQIHPEYSVATTIIKLIESPASNKRYAAYRIIRKLKLKKYASTLAKRIKKEKSPHALAELIKSLGSFYETSSRADVADFFRHDSALVRKQVAYALGQYSESRFFENLKKLLFDANKDVQLATIEAITKIKDNTFEDSLIKYMNKSVKSPMYSSKNRASACKAIAELNDISLKQIKCLIRILTKKIIPVPMSPKQFDSSLIRISALFALKDKSEKSLKVKKTTYALAIKLIKNARDKKNNKLQVNLTLESAAEEIYSFFKGTKEPTRINIPTKKISFPYTKVR
ncbi:MAG: hypothetical protein U9O87_08245 [Verrucomicrobiota bacterium]|nr:hypothetical protein [Verrucomicrobiota bacterium]